MGVNLKPLIIKHELSFKDLKGKKISIDAYNWLYQFLTIIRQPDGTPLKNEEGKVTSHLTGLFYRTCRLLEEGIKPCYVFDGEPPSFKIVIDSRIEHRERAREQYELAKKEGNIRKAYQMAMQSARLTHGMIEESKRLLGALGIPVVQAPSEGEAQASFMVTKGDVYAVATQDYDSFLFGAKRVVRNLSITGKRRVGNYYVAVKPELILLDELLRHNNITREELVTLGLLVGTDYNPGGIKGIGPKKGLKLVQKYGAEAWKHVEGWDINVEETIKFFLNPPVIRNYKIEWRPPDNAKVRRLLIDEFGFSEERVNNALKKVNKATAQRNLDLFFS